MQDGFDEGGVGEGSGHVEGIGPPPMSGGTPRRQCGVTDPARRTGLQDALYRPNGASPLRGAGKQNDHVLTRPTGHRLAETESGEGPRIGSRQSGRT